jgi:hypothetical protein
MKLAARVVAGLWNRRRGEIKLSPYLLLLRGCSRILRGVPGGGLLVHVALIDR